MKITIQSLPFQVGTFEQIIRTVTEKILSNQSQIILPCDLASLANLSQHQDLAAAYREIDICTTDGIPLVWLSKYKTQEQVERVYGPDLMSSLLQNSKIQKLRHAFYGSANQENLDELIEKILIKSPNLNIQLAISPPLHPLSFSSEKNYFSKIKAAQPDVLWIGLSSPLQIQVAAKLKKILPNTTILCVGAAFDFLAEVKPSAPSWMKKNGLEWFFRLINEPKRLWKRYLITIPRFLLCHGWELLFQ